MYLSIPSRTCTPPPSFSSSHKTCSLFPHRFLFLSISVFLATSIVSSFATQNASNTSQLRVTLIHSQEQIGIQTNRKPVFLLLRVEEKDWTEIGIQWTKESRTSRRTRCWTREKDSFRIPSVLSDTYIVIEEYPLKRKR